jgi:hypothetical protein
LADFGRRHVQGVVSTVRRLSEYALMVALVAIAIIGAVTFLSDSIGNSFNNTGNAL